MAIPRRLAINRKMLFIFYFFKSWKEDYIPTTCRVNVLLGLGGRKRRKIMAKINANSSEKRKLNWSIGKPAILATGLKIFEPLYVEIFALSTGWSIMMIFFFKKIIKSIRLKKNINFIIYLNIWQL